MLAALPEMDDELLTTATVVRGAGYPPPSPIDYSAAIVDRIRPVRWRSEVLALVRRPIPVTLEAARVTAAAFIKRATNFTDDQRAFLRLLEAGELRAELLGDERDRIAANPALLWRLRVGAERLEER